MAEKLSNLGEINAIQKEIEKYTKNIEHEKINLRLAKERYEKQLENLVKLQNDGKPGAGAQKNQELERSHIRHQSTDDLQREEVKFEKNIKLINDEINTIAEENKILRKQIEELRKEKITTIELLENLTNINEQTKRSFEELYRKNKHNKEDDDGLLSIIIINKDLKKLELEAVKSINEEEDTNFVKNREMMEKKYQEVLEENIKIERNHKKELVAKKLTSKQKENKELAMMAEEDISDRAPILESLIEKWKYFTKSKKAILERYLKNSTIINDAFDKMAKFLGLDNHDNLPFILEKMEAQMDSIEKFISSLTEDQNQLEEEKKILEGKIKQLRENNLKSNKAKTTFTDNKTHNILKLKESIKEIEDDMERRRQFFEFLQPSTDKFLKRLQNSYITEYIPCKAVLMEEIKYNESTIIDIVANVQDYQKLMDEIEKTEYEKRKWKEELVKPSKDLDKLENDNKQKLDLVGKDLLGSYKLEKVGNFDEAIKKMADDILKNMSGKREERKKATNTSNPSSHNS